MLHNGQGVFQLQFSVDEKSKHVNLLLPHLNAVRDMLVSSCKSVVIPCEMDTSLVHFGLWITLSGQCIGLVLSACSFLV